MSQVGTMVRTAVVVSNLERSVEFYSELLGLTETYAEGELSHPAATKLLGADPKSKLRFKIIKAPGHPNRGMVGLFELSNPKPERLQKPKGTVSAGEGIMVFYCDDIATVNKKLEYGGHTIICPPMYLQVRPGRGQPEMTFADPDGMLINLIQRDPDDPS